MKSVSPSLGISSTYSSRSLATGSSTTLANTSNIVVSGNVEDRMPPVASLALIFNMTLLLGVNFAVVVPTADDYAHRLGAGEEFAGLMIGVFGFGAMACVGLCQLLLQRITLKTLLSILALGSVLGNILYALAAPMRFKWTLPASRFLQGLSDALNLPTQYIGLTVGLKRRSEVVLIFSGIIMLGYAVAPALAAVIQELVNVVHIGKFVLDSGAAPGWFMALAYSLHWVLLLLTFEDLPMELTRPPQRKEQAERACNAEFPRVGSSVLFWNLTIASSMISIVEVYIVDVGQRHWGWSITVSALYVALLMFISGITNVAMSQLARRHIRSDRAGLLVCSILGCVVCVPLVSLELHALSARLSALTPVLLITLTIAGLIRAFAIALASKIVQSSLKFEMNNFVAVNLCFGRGVGGLIGAAMQPNSFGPVMEGMFAISAVINSFSYSRIVQSTRAD